jgi:4-hydroxybenzoate polyprenyltransferase
MSILISPWLIVCPLFIAIVLGLGKRHADLKFMKEKALKHKEVLKAYNTEIINALMIISTTCLIMSYSLYALAKSGWLMITLPFAIYTVFRYYQLVNQESEIARNPGKFYTDTRILIAIICWAILLFIIMYYLPHDTSMIFLQ